MFTFTKAKLISYRLLPFLLLASVSHNTHAQEQASISKVATMASQIETDVIKWRRHFH